MDVRIDQLMDLPELKSLKLVSGSKGVSNIVKWVHSLETPDLLTYVEADELILLTGIGIVNNSSSFIEFTKGLIEKKAAGLIVNVGKYLDKVPEDIKELSDKNDFPIFETPWEVSLGEITKVICGDIVKRHLEEASYQDLLKNVLFNKITYEYFTKTVSACGYNYLKSFRIVVVSIDKFQQYLDTQNIKDEQAISHMKDVFLRTVNSSIWDSRYRHISFLQNDSAVFLVINEKDKFLDIEALAQFIRDSVKESFSDTTVSIGIGNVYAEFSEIKKSYVEARKALKVIKAEGNTDKTIFYSNIGTYKLLTEIENISLLKEYYYDTVGKLEKYDLQNGTDYTRIFYTFLQENCNYVQTSQRLYMHRNTLIYKINKIQDIIKRDLTDMTVKLEFYIGYLIKQINDF